MVIILILTKYKISFTPSWVMSLLTIFAIFLFVRLGFWQLERAQEKKQMLAAMRQFAKLPPIDLVLNNKLPAQYQQIKINGNYLPQVLLLDNQHRNHNFGYDVISLLRTNNGKIILVDRGWVAGDITRRIYPQIKNPTGNISIAGSVYYPSSKNWVLGQAIEEKTNDLAIIESLDTKLLGQFLHKSVYPFIIRLNRDIAYGYMREWAIVSMPPNRHYAYAFQWFAIAIAVLVIFIGLNFKKESKK